VSPDALTAAEPWRLPVLVGGIAFVYLAAGVFDHGIWSPTEPAVAGVVWNMFERGLVVAPHIDVHAYLEKPPLYYWLGWLAVRLHGDLDAGWLRLPAALLGLACLAAVSWSVRRRHGDAVACAVLPLAALVYPLWELAHRATPDVAALAFAFVAFALFERSLAGADAPAPRRTWPWDLALAATLAASFYAKNFFVVYVVAPPVVGVLLWQRAWVRLALLAGAGAACVALFVAPWAAALYAADPDYVRVVFVDNTLGRFVDLPAEARPALGPLNDAYDAERDGPPWIYLAHFAAIVAPWSLAFLAGLGALARRQGDPRRGFQIAALIGVPLALMLSSSRNAGYLRPLLFVHLLVIADLLAEVARGGVLARWERMLVLANGAIVALAVVGLPVALGVVFDTPALFVWGAVCAVALALGARHWRGTWLHWRSVSTAGTLAVIGLAGTWLLAVPAIDERRSVAAFYRDVAVASAGRALHTTLGDDRRLPLVGWYLRRTAPAVEPKRVPELLAGETPVGVVMLRREYEAERRQIDPVAPTIVAVDDGKARKLVFVANDAR
jgi:4-amino-4-deoxy-L-arabinose transferase-like glycosyltransferase